MTTCKHKPINPGLKASELISMPQICKKCGKQISISHPVLLRVTSGAIHLVALFVLLISLGHKYSPVVFWGGVVIYAAIRILLSSFRGYLFPWYEMNSEIVTHSEVDDEEQISSPIIEPVHFHVDHFHDTQIR